MKTRAVSTTNYYICKSENGCRYPNSATRRYQTERILNGMLAAAITLSAVVIAVVLITM